MPTRDDDSAGRPGAASPVATKPRNTDRSVHVALADRLQATSRAIAALATSIGCLVAVSWILQLPGLSRIHPLLGGMSGRAALCFILAGTALLLEPSRGFSRSTRALGRLCAVGVVAMSAVTIAQAYGWAHGIDAFIQGPSLPGRMPLATALVFLAFGLGLLFIEVDLGRVRPTEFLSFTGALIALLALIGYAYHFVSFFEIPKRRPLAFHTVLLMMVFAFGLLAARSRRGLMRLATSHSPGGVMVRHMLPAAVGAPVLAGWLIMEGQRAGWYLPALSLSYYTILLIVVFSTMIWATAVSLHRLDIRRREAEGTVIRLNAELEQRVVERTEQLESANRELEAFSYSVSHDLRAPLRHIGGFAQLLAKEQSGDPAPKQQRYIGLIAESVTRMGDLIDGLLSFSRMARTEMMSTRVDLNSVIRSAQSEIQGQYTDHKIEWTVHPLPTVRGDSAMLTQVFTNLLSNAAKYSRTRHPSTIEIGSSSAESEIVVYVRDNGAGFDMQYAGKLFGVFQRLHRAEDFEGTGIGLANVQRIVSRHGGRVWAEAKPDEGATFFVALPT
jgi:signal transduction histidine kinase